MSYELSIFKKSFCFYIQIDTQWSQICMAGIQQGAKGFIFTVTKPPVNSEKIESSTNSTDWDHVEKTG